MDEWVLEYRMLKWEGWGKMFTGREMGDEMRWCNDTERLTLEPEWMNYWVRKAQWLVLESLQGVVYLQAKAKRSCTKRVQRKYKQILSLLYLNSVTFLLGSGITFIISLFLFFLLGSTGVGRPGLPLSTGHKKGFWGGSWDHLYCWLLTGKGIGISSRFHVYTRGAVTHTICQRQRDAF